jgi:hypothetical protein
MRQGRLMVLTLLALALPTAALAKSFSFFTGKFGDTINSSIPSRTASGGFGVAGTNFRIGVEGSLNFIHLGGAILGPGCNPSGGGAGSCSFTGGTVTVSATPTSSVLFTDSLVSGTITKTSTTAVITGFLTANSEVPAGSTVIFRVSFGGTAPFSNRLTDGTGKVSIIPEPSTLLSLGTGLVGLAGLTKRKLTKLNLRT